MNSLSQWDISINLLRNLPNKSRESQFYQSRWYSLILLKPNSKFKIKTKQSQVKQQLNSNSTQHSIQINRKQIRNRSIYHKTPSMKSINLSITWKTTLRGPKKMHSMMGLCLLEIHNLLHPRNLIKITTRSKSNRKEKQKQRLKRKMKNKNMLHVTSRSSINR